MVSDLRKKFVIVTTTLMIVIFGAFFIVTQIANSYWTKVDTADFLYTLAYSDFFLTDIDGSVEDTIETIIEEDNPIFGIIVDKAGNMVSSKTIGNSARSTISQTTIANILKADTKEYRINSYVYARRQLEDEKTLIVITDTSIDDNFTTKLISTIGIAICGIIILVLITFYLSRFVTEPAKAALLREKQFISDASHELKTPLGAISINAQALSANMPENIYTRNIINESNRMARLIEKLLTLSKFDEGNISSQEKISLSNLAYEMFLTYESLAFEKGFTYNYEIENDIDIIGNADEIRQLMTILVDNAIKNTNENGSIEICCKSVNGEVELVVKNTGAGISAEDLPHVFERFYTSDTSRSNKSFGLGLAIANAIVKEHNGKLQVSSIQNQYTEFTASFKTI